MTFLNWIAEQHHRDDVVGDLARDVRDDKKSLQRYFSNRSFSPLDLPEISFQDMHRYMRTQGACSEALEALIEAYREWKKLNRNLIPL